MNLSYFILGTIFELSFVAIFLFYHRKLIAKYKKPLLIVNLVGIIYWFASDTIAYQTGVWSMSKEKITGVWIGPIPFEDFFFGLAALFIVSMTVVLMKDAYSQNKAIRQVLFKKD